MRVLHTTWKVFGSVMRTFCLCSRQPARSCPYILAPTSVTTALAEGKTINMPDTHGDPLLSLRSSTPQRPQQSWRHTLLSSAVLERQHLFGARFQEKLLLANQNHSFGNEFLLLCHEGPQNLHVWHRADGLADPLEVVGGAGQMQRPAYRPQAAGTGTPVCKQIQTCPKLNPPAGLRAKGAPGTSFW